MNIFFTEESIPQYFENYDLDNIQTPVLVDRLVNLLRESKYNESKVRFLEKGFRKGFDIGYEGPKMRQSTSANIPFTVGVGDKVEMWNKLMKEVKLKRVAGPYEVIPFENFIQSPIGLVPKSEGKTRLIFHLSYKFEWKGEDGKGSLNQHTPRSKCKVKYRDLDYTISAYLKLVGVTKTRSSNDAGRNKNSEDGRKIIYGGKTDVQSAFRLLPLLKSCWQCLIMKAQDPLTGQWKYFIDKCLPFGASITCALFQEFSDALCHLMEFKTQAVGLITNYLDDFLFLALTILRCNAMIQQFLELCKDIGVPIAFEKTEWGNELIIFLGSFWTADTLSWRYLLRKRNMQYTC